MSPDADRAVVLRPRGHFKARPYTIVQKDGDTVRIDHCAHRVTAWVIQTEWNAGLYDQYPGEVRRFSAPKEGETA